MSKALRIVGLRLLSSELRRALELARRRGEPPEISEDRSES